MDPQSSEASAKVHFALDAVIHLNVVRYIICRMTSDIKPDTQEFILSQVQDALRDQLGEARRTDGQVTQVFGGATIVAGLFGLSISVDHINATVVTLYGMGFLAYLLASLFTFRALTCRINQTRLHPTLLKSESSEKYVFELIKELLKGAREDYENNVDTLTRKNRQRYFLIGTVALEFLLFLSGMALSFLSQGISIHGKMELSSEHLWGLYFGVFVLASGIFVLPLVFSNIPRALELTLNAIGIAGVLIAMGLLVMSR